MNASFRRKGVRVADDWGENVSPYEQMRIMELDRNYFIPGAAGMAFTHSGSSCEKA